MHRKKLWPGAAALLLVVLSLGLLAGCKKTEQQVNETEQQESETEQPESESETEQPESETEVEQTTSETSGAGWEFGIIEDSTVEEGAVQLMTQLSASRGDYEAFRELCTSDSDDTIVQQYCNGIGDISGYDRHSVQILAQNGNKYFADIVSYKIAGSAPDTYEEDASYQFIIVQEDGNWKLDLSESELNNLNQAYQYSSFIPEEVSAAYNEGRNSTAFFSNYMFADSKAVYEGCVDGDIIFAWQDTNGDVHLQIWMANGMSQDIYLVSVQAIVTDSSYGTVLDYSQEIGETIPAGTGTCFVITVPASEVQSGTQPWGSMMNDLYYNWSE